MLLELDELLLRFFFAQELRIAFDYQIFELSLSDLEFVLKTFDLFFLIDQLRRLAPALLEFVRDGSR